MNAQWKNTTGYSRGDKERVPTTWTLPLTSGIQITVTCGHIYYKGKWVMHCCPWFDTYPLNDQIKTADEAQNAALGLVHIKVAEIAAAIAKATTP